MAVETQFHLGLPAESEALPPVETPAPPQLVRRVDVAVVGAGPGGLAAAVAAAEAGTAVLVVDEQWESGGQYFKPLAPSHRFADTTGMDDQFSGGRALTERVRALGIEVLQQAAVWGAFRDDAGAIELGVLAADGAFHLRPEQLIVATGAYERAFPRPGWTLPGVMTTGAAQILARAYRSAPGSRMLIAGNGPLNFQVACELLRGGVEVVSLVEAAPRPGLKQIPSLVGAWRAAPDLTGRGLAFLRTIRKHSVPVLYRHSLLRVEGEERAEAATVGQIDSRGRPLAGTERTFEVDTVCLGYGLLPSNEITRLLGCRHAVEPTTGGLIVERDGFGESSRPGVFAVGDCAEIEGARVALAEGRIAGWSAARNLGKEVPDTTEFERTRAALARERTFQGALRRIFQAPPGFDEGIADEVLICRCEEVSAAEVRANLAKGISEIGALKRVTRVGMGRCQGRYCGPLLARLCGGAGRPLDEYALFAPRVPIKPIPAAAIAAAKSECRDVLSNPPPPALARTLPVNVEPDRETDIVIIGAGIIGACSAYSTARAGLDVVVLERGQPNNLASGGNAGSLHIQFLSYSLKDEAMAMGRPVAEALPLYLASIRRWEEIEKELRVDLEVAITGGLVVAENKPELERLKSKAEVERAYGVPVEMIGPSELQDLAPMVAKHMVGASWCPREGRINPLLATQAVIEAAEANGARLFRETEVRSIERVRGIFVIGTNRGVFRARRLLNAAGACAGQIAAMVGTRLPIRSSPLQMIVTEPVSPLIHHLVLHGSQHLTLKQVANGNVIIGGAWTAALNPKTQYQQVLRESLQGNLWVALQVVPALRGVHVLRSWATTSGGADGAPILGEAPGVSGFFNAVTTNGVTLAPIIGEINADLLSTGRTDWSMAPFSVERLG
jgi:glycine/D-amino acid oxidase-like deaminating enzyme/bacterioferritin-associated ferredoxin